MASLPGFPGVPLSHGTWGIGPDVPTQGSWNPAGCGEDPSGQCRARALLLEEAQCERELRRSHTDKAGKLPRAQLLAG